MNIKGEIKTLCEDFEVEEVPAYEPSGEGEHLYLWVEKQDASAKFALRQLSRALGVRDSEVGQAGNKDRRAVTRQYYSAPIHQIEPEVREALLAGEGLEVSAQLRVLSARLHGNKLRRGHLTGNRFVIKIRNLEWEGADRQALEAELAARIERLERGWLANFYGEQRFGQEDSTVELGLAMLRQESWAKKKLKRDRFLKRLALNAVQSRLFNLVLRARLEQVDEQGFLKVLDGDVMELVERGGLFVTEDVATEQERLIQREIMITGPMFGPKMYSPASEAREFEERIMRQEFGLELDVFDEYSKVCPGSRRALKVKVDDLSWEMGSENEVTLSFFLSSGSYATVVLEHLFDELIVHDATSPAG